MKTKTVTKLADDEIEQQVAAFRQKISKELEENFGKPYLEPDAEGGVLVDVFCKNHREFLEKIEFNKAVIL